MVNITEILASNDAVNAIAAAIEILPGGREALNTTIIAQIKAKELINPVVVEELPVTPEITPTADIVLE